MSKLSLLGEAILVSRFNCIF